MPISKPSKLPLALARSISFWRSIIRVSRTFVMPVAKCPCQKSVSFSSSGRVVVSIRSPHHVASRCVSMELDRSP